MRREMTRVSFLMCPFCVRVSSSDKATLTPPTHSRRPFTVAGGNSSAFAALAWNPSVTGGAKSEDTILVSDEGVEIVTRTPDLGEIQTAGEPRPAIVEV